MIPTGGIFTNIPNSSLLRSPKLCGSILGIPPWKHKHHYFRSQSFLIAFSIIIFIIGFISIVCFVIGCQRLRANRRLSKVRNELQDMSRNFPRITYKELVEATAGFDKQRLVGSSDYSVFTEESSQTEHRSLSKSCSCTRETPPRFSTENAKFLRLLPPESDKDHHCLHYAGVQGPRSSLHG